MSFRFPEPAAACSRSRRGAALIITLVVLVLLSIMVVSLTDIMRAERGASHAHLEKARAEMVAQIGMAKVVATLRKETADSGRNWISQPGQLVASDPAVDPTANNAKTLITPAMPLSSGPPVNVGPTFATAALRPAQLNVPTFEQGVAGAIPPHLITNLPDPANSSKAVQMAVRWVYVRQDGTEDLAEQPVLTNTANPIVGRYAYWTDDESSKVNYNLAWTRGDKNLNPASHPTRINLPTILGGTSTTSEEMADAIHFYDPLATTPPVIPTTVATYRAFPRFFFQTPEDARQVERLKGGVDAALLAAKFNVTHYNHDPDTTFFNEPRIVLTTDKEKAGGRPFLDIAATDPSTGKPYTDLWEPFVDPTVPSYRIDPAKLADTIDMLNNYLKRKDWPMAPGSTLQAKYYAGKEARLTQLSLNIINYVRTKESAGEPTTKVVVPVRGEQAPGGRFVLMEIATSANAYIGITRTPKITEMAVWVKSTPTSGTTYQCKYKCEVYLPKNFGLPSIDLTKLSLYTNGAESNVLATDVVIPNHGGAVLAAGEYATITKTASMTFSSRPTTTTLRFAIALGSGISVGKRRLDVAPLGTAADCKVDPPGTPESDISSIEVDDPRVNSHRADWKQRSGNSFGAKNSISTIGSAPSNVLPQQDTNEMGKITDISLYMPPRKGDPANLTGLVASAGELGYIHTGMESGAGAGIPWRTLRLQPNNYPGVDNADGVHVPSGATVYPPDWAFMDLFTVPADIPPDVAGKPSPKSVYLPHGTATGGRVNMNAKPVPFNLERVDPLAAVFEGATYDATDLTKKISNARARNIATAIYNRELVKGISNVPDGKQYGYQAGYDSPGEVVEIKGVADEGEASEQLVREVANLITSRGNVFTIYTVGQALKQTPAGSLVVTGEQRQQSMVERYSDAGGVRFRSMYFRNLTP